MRSGTVEQLIRPEIDIKLTYRDQEAMRRQNACMTTNDYLEFLKSIKIFKLERKPRKIFQGDKFELPC